MPSSETANNRDYNHRMGALDDSVEADRRRIAARSAENRRIVQQALDRKSRDEAAGQVLVQEFLEKVAQMQNPPTVILPSRVEEVREFRNSTMAALIEQRIVDSSPIRCWNLVPWRWAGEDRPSLACPEGIGQARPYYISDQGFRVIDHRTKREYPVDRSDARTETLTISWHSQPALPDDIVYTDSTGSKDEGDYRQMRLLDAMVVFFRNHK